MTFPTVAKRPGAVNLREFSPKADQGQEILALTNGCSCKLPGAPRLWQGCCSPDSGWCCFGALFAKAPEASAANDGHELTGRFLGLRWIGCSPAFSAGAPNAGLPKYVRSGEFGFLNELLVGTLRSRSSIVIASCSTFTSLSLAPEPGDSWVTAALLGLQAWPGVYALCLVLVTPAAARLRRDGTEAWASAYCPCRTHRIDSP